MACLLLCFDDSPVKEHRRAGRIGQFQITLTQGLWKAQPICCMSYCFPPCMNYWTRLQVLNGDINEYTCCQGYFDGVCCVKSGRCGERTAPHLCLALESCCCLGPSMSASRMLVMDKYDLSPDKCDWQLIRFSNCVNMLSCVCEIASLINRDLRHLSHLINSFADFVFYTTLGMMAAQTVNEVRYQRERSGTFAHAVAYPEGKAVPGEAEDQRETDLLLAKNKALL